jgi:hypothetical protein
LRINISIYMTVHFFFQYLTTSRLSMLDHVVYVVVVVVVVVCVCNECSSDFRLPSLLILEKRKN